MEKRAVETRDNPVKRDRQTGRQIYARKEARTSDLKLYATEDAMCEWCEAEGHTEP